ncbi:hypothetical protein JTB14_024880 [Gonioctena quinquepunctata]|nr:hypothetical protein JTB14_024880 [Gonioctena quinquepunctata]
MMANGGEFPYYKDPNLKCEIMGFPYKGNSTVMYVVMPFHSDSQKLKELENSLTPADLELLADRTVYTRAVMLLPKMKIESTINLKAALVNLGVKSLFDPKTANLALLSPGEGATGNLNSRIGEVENNQLSLNSFRNTVNCSNIFNNDSNISTCLENVTGPNGSQNADINQQSTDNSNQNPGLYADKIVHKVYMDITETGTEAAASTSVSLSRDGSRVTFRVDVPFFFFIRHEETKTILFWGSVNTPTPNFKRN